jgi:hypothetical protein
MIERNFYEDEFEELLRNKTDQYKMYPSEPVWKGVYGSLHTRRKRFIFGMSLLISGILIFAGKELLTPSRQLAELRKSSPAKVDERAGDATRNAAPVNPILSFSGLKKENLYQEPASSNPLYTPGLQHFGDGNADNPPQVDAAPLSESSVNSFSNAPLVFVTPAADPLMVNNSVNHLQVENAGAVAGQPSLQTDGLAPAKTGVEKNGLTPDEEKDKNQVNWIAEYASEQLSPLKKNRFGWQAYFSPTENYRRLSGGNNYADVKSSDQNVPIALIQSGSANQFVDNVHAIGLEAGGALLYRITRNITLKGGLQFNYSRYIIQAYSSTYPERSTIVLNSSVSPLYGYIADSVTSYSNIRTFGGKSSENLENRYFQISAPIGFEMKLIGNGRLQLGIGGTIQPTYLLNRNAYVLTTDYSGYTKVPSLFRKWNLNGGMEAFVSYQIAGLRWQIGPQLRYQFLSTYSNKYPIKENLVQYGLKIGISKVAR